MSMRRPSYFSQFVPAPSSLTAAPLLQPPRLLFRGGPSGVDMVVPRPASTAPTEPGAAMPPDFETRPAGRSRADGEPPTKQAPATPAQASAAIRRAPMPFPEGSRPAVPTVREAAPPNRALSPTSARPVLAPAGSSAAAAPPAMRAASEAASAPATTVSSARLAAPPADLPPASSRAASPVLPPRAQAASSIPISLPPRRAAAGGAPDAGLRIGTLEVRVAAPPAAPQANARPSQPRAAAPAIPAPRIARPFAAFGLNQS